LLLKKASFATAIDGITLMRVDHNTPPLAVLQEPTLVFVLQGSKRGYIGTETYAFQQGECLIVSVSMPFDCDTVASPELPMIAVSMKLEADTVNELLAKTYFENEQFKPLTTGMSVIQYDQTISNVLIRLLKTLGSEQDSLILGEQIKRELLYRVIQHSGADALKGLVAQGNLRPIYKICEYIQHHFTEKLTVEMLAEQANMSISHFIKHSNKSHYIHRCSISKLHGCIRQNKCCKTKTKALLKQLMLLVIKAHLNLVESLKSSLVFLLIRLK
jgi:AraC-like DNA-binding protein